MSRVTVTSGCWEWKGGVNHAGYGMLASEEGKTILAHRYSYEKLVGPIPSGLQVCHSCDNPPCVNPLHLWVGTNLDNINDKVSKGRAAKKSLFSKEEVLEIRELVRWGMKGAELARVLGCSASTIYRIISGTRHKTKD